MKTQKVQAAIIGATGYTGIELIRLIALHPNIQPTVITSRKEYGKKLYEIHPFLSSLPYAETELSPLDPITISRTCDIAFLAVPHGTGMEIASQLIEQGIKVIDLSADFRLNNSTTYTQWYHFEHKAPHLLSNAVYGIPELNEESIKTAQLIANPGCYPTSIILGLLPAIKHRLIKLNSIVIDSKSGTSGAGRNTLTSSFLFCEVQDSFKAYNVGTHRHTPEIEQELSYIAGQPITVTFSPHLLPITRGILSTIYTHLEQPISQDEVYNLYKDTWRNHPWIRIFPPNKLPETRHVRGTMFCDIGLIVDRRTQRLVVISAIDNLCRGASGQAVANANLMFNLPITAGLISCPLL